MKTYDDAIRAQATYIAQQQKMREIGRKILSSLIEQLTANYKIPDGALLFKNRKSKSSATLENCILYDEDNCRITIVLCVNNDKHDMSLHV